MTALTLTMSFSSEIRIKADTTEGAPASQSTTVDVFGSITP